MVGWGGLMEKGIEVKGRGEYHGRRVLESEQRDEERVANREEVKDKGKG